MSRLTQETKQLLQPPPAVAGIFAITGPTGAGKTILDAIPTDLYELMDQQTIEEKKGYLFEQFVVRLFKIK
jgi:type II secretory ATPase GspE/PulE/Tfp pilus assembly ATPase PilB-like protein